RASALRQTSTSRGLVRVATEPPAIATIARPTSPTRSTTLIGKLLLRNERRALTRTIPQCCHRSAARASCRPPEAPSVLRLNLGSVSTCPAPSRIRYLVSAGRPAYRST